jgi:Xaa-Pro aminopeptidase
MNNRLLKVKQLLTKKLLDAILISSVSDITYLTGYSNFSRDEREAYLFITNNNQFILTDDRYSTAINKQVKDFQLLEISATYPFKKLLQQLKQKYRLNSLGIDENNLSISEYKIIKSCFNDLNHQSIHDLRVIKDRSEIETITKACGIGDKTFDYILKQIKPDVSEKELALKLEFYIKKLGADISFKPIIAFGANAAIPHHKTSDLRLTSPKPGEGGLTSPADGLILLDFGVKYADYCSDMTRTVFFGNATKEQKKVYETVLHAQELAVQQYNNVTIELNKTILASSLDKVAREYIISQGFDSIPHSLGHGIGLQVHEAPSISPKSKVLLAEGMVFTIEPGIYLPEKFGLRIEDLFVIEKNKLKQLTTTPKNIIEL